MGFSNYKVTGACTIAAMETKLSGGADNSEWEVRRLGEELEMTHLKLLRESSRPPHYKS